jgi:hypothetical protein
MTQHKHLARVADNIGETVVEFMRRHVRKAFRADALRSYVTARHPGIAPESPGRIMRDLRKRGLVEYELVSRAQSMYHVVSVRA